MVGSFGLFTPIRTSSRNPPSMMSIARFAPPPLLMLMIISGLGFAVGFQLPGGEPPSAPDVLMRIYICVLLQFELTLEHPWLV